MNKQRKTSHILNVFQYDHTTGAVTLPAGLSLPTPDSTDNSTKVATTAWIRAYVGSLSYATASSVETAIANLVASAPTTLDTLNELATALGNDPNFATTITTSIGTKVPQSRTITINGTAYDLSADRAWTIASGVTSFNTRTGAITLTSGDVTGALGFTPYNATNPSGYISGITSAMVTGALGYTPYNSSNPSGYITGITSGMVTGALGYTPYNSSNPSGYISQSTADGRYLMGTTNPGSVNNFTISIGNNGTYSYVQSHSGQPLELNPVGNTVRIAGQTVIHSGNIGSYAVTSESIGTNNTAGVVGAKYQLNNEWLRVNSDDRQFQIYGNARTLIYRTDGNSNSHGGGGYAHIFYYGGSADGNRVFIINTDGRLYSPYHGWLDTMSVSYASSAGNADTVDGYHVSTSGSANTIPTRNGNGYLSPENWIQLNGHYGLYSGTNGAHFYPNNLSYGSWRVEGSRNGWSGIHFGGGTGMTLMMNETEFGFHREAHGWYARFTNGRFYGNADYAYSAGEVAWGNVSSKPSSIFQYPGWGNWDANTIPENYSSFSYSNSCPWTGPLSHFSAGGYGLQLNANYGNGTGISYRTRNGDGGYWNTWYRLYSDTYRPYADSAGNADTVDGEHASNFATHRGEGRNYVEYSRYVYNNGAYSGSGWIEPSDLGVRYAASSNYSNSTGSLSGFDKNNPSFGAVYSDNWFRAYNDTGLYSQSYGGHIRRSLGSSFGNWETFGYERNGWSGFCYVHNYLLNIMSNTSGDHGFYQENGNGWTLFYNRGNNCWGIGTDNTYSGDGFRCVKYGSSQYGWTTWSDRRAKENITSITGALDKVLNMRGVYFNYISDDAKTQRVGFIAQELEQVLPEAVRYAEEIDEYNVEYAQIVSVLTEAIKEQNVKITRLEALVEQLINN